MITKSGALNTFLIFLVESSNNIMLMFDTTKFIKGLATTACYNINAEREMKSSVHI